MLKAQFEASCYHANVAINWLVGHEGRLSASALTGELVTEGGQGLVRG